MKPLTPEEKSLLARGLVLEGLSMPPEMMFYAHHLVASIVDKLGIRDELTAAIGSTVDQVAGELNEIVDGVAKRPPVLRVTPLRLVAKD